MTKADLNKAYNPQEIETNWYKTWENNNYFQPQGNNAPYCIMLPPPNVTGRLHMGHGYGFTLIDVLIRYQRMCGKTVLWQAGTDHAGIATQMVVERQLNQENKTRHDIGRDAFIEKVWAWKEESGSDITRQLRRLGASIDWSRERFTMDENFSHAVREVFIKLFDEGLIYRGERLVNWDPVLLTAISDLEVVNEEVDGKLWHIRYPLADNSNYIVVATTRPETLLGDVAVAVHPEDARYQHLIGKMLKLPLTTREIPIIADDCVDPEFGSGCVKITPAHDFNDYATGQRHNLKPINIFTKTATLNENAPPQYQGLDRFVARKNILADLETQELIEKIEPHKLKLPKGDRSNAVIEPYLTHQWYVSSKDLAKDAIHAVESGEVKFIPENWDKTYFHWMHNIEDWCISRQLWWGHRIPVWYDAAKNSYSGQSENDVRIKYNLSADTMLTQDEDVLDTWFSSALWPFATLGWPEKTVDLAKFFPTSVLVTGFDIIFFWVARMLMLSLKFMKQVPFKEIYITGLIRDAEGHKMSKTKGNVLDPIDLIDGIDIDTLVQKRIYGLMQPAMAQKIEKATRKEFKDGIPSYGTDALRMTFCSFASFAREIKFDLNRLGGYKHFCNKLWNAARYVIMNLESVAEKNLLALEIKNIHFSLADQWILSRLQKTITEAHAAIAQYRFDLLVQELYDFTWNEFCDWYLELSKPILTTDLSSKENLLATQFTLLYTLESLLRLLHPIIPFITEEIWQKLSPFTHNAEPTIMLAKYPQANSELTNQHAEEELEWLKKIISAIRTIRSERNIAPGKKLAIFLRHGNNKDHKGFENHKLLLSTLAKIEKIEWLKENQTPPPAASSIVGELEILVPLAEFMNLADEKNRIKKEIEKLQQDLNVIATKLATPAFADKAPAQVVAKEKSRQTEIIGMIAKLNAQADALAHALPTQSQSAG